MSALAERFLEGLEGVRRTHDGWMACCPHHDDRNPSLHVVVGDDGRVVLHCHAGCSPDDVVAAHGRTMADLFESPAIVTNGDGASEAYDYVNEAWRCVFNGSQAR